MPQLKVQVEIDDSYAGDVEGWFNSSENFGYGFYIEIKSGLACWKLGPI